MIMFIEKKKGGDERTCVCVLCSRVRVVGTPVVNDFFYLCCCFSNLSGLVFWHPRAFPSASSFSRERVPCILDMSLQSLSGSFQPFPHFLPPPSPHPSPVF